MICNASVRIPVSTGTPPHLPDPAPQWFDEIDEGEKVFLQRSLQLDRVDRVCRAATVYAELNVTDLAQAVHTSQRPWAPIEVEKLLRRAWRRLFDEM